MEEAKLFGLWFLPYHDQMRISVAYNEFDLSVNYCPTFSLNLGEQMATQSKQKLLYFGYMAGTPGYFAVAVNTRTTQR